jgi:hypothetical protein
MGRQYEEPFRQLVADLNPDSLLAFIDTVGVNPKYREHIASTLADLGVRTVDTAAAANFIVSGYVVRDSDAVIGLAIHSDALGAITLFPEGYESPVGAAA